MTTHQICAVAGFLGFLIGLIWGAVLAFRTSVGWGLAFLFLPLGWVVFLLGHLRRTSRATALVFCSAALVGFGIANMPSRAQAKPTASTKESKQEGPTLEQQWETKVAARQAQINDCQAQADRRCAELNQKRALTDPKDKVAVAAFNAEVIEYNSLLERLRNLRRDLNNP